MSQHVIGCGNRLSLGANKLKSPMYLGLSPMKVVLCDCSIQDHHGSQYQRRDLQQQCPRDNIGILPPFKAKIPSDYTSAVSTSPSPGENATHPRRFLSSKLKAATASRTQNSTSVNELHMSTKYIFFISVRLRLTFRHNDPSREAEFGLYGAK